MTEAAAAARKLPYGPREAFLRDLAFLLACIGDIHGAQTVATEGGLLGEAELWLNYAYGLADEGNTAEAETLINKWEPHASKSLYEDKSCQGGPVVRDTRLHLEWAKGPRFRISYDLMYLISLAREVSEDGVVVRLEDELKKAAALARSEPFPGGIWSDASARLWSVGWRLDIKLKRVRNPWQRQPR